MNIFDQYIFQLLVFSPIMAAIFITLIPTIDTGSKLAISKFFSIIIAAIFIRTFYIYQTAPIFLKTKISFLLININIQINLNITPSNIYLFATAIASLFVMVSYIVNDTKTNIHQVTPFLLTFVLFITFGQLDLRVALPILSISNFLLYFLIGFSDKIKRGLTIFQMGIFLFFCDGLSLIILQIDSPIFIKSIILLLPGLSRMLLPMLAPFAKKLILNIDDIEGPFLIVFLQLSGFFILILAKNSLPNFQPDLIIVVSIITVMGAIYIALTAINDSSIRNLPYYFFIFYSSTSAGIFFLSYDYAFQITLPILITNIICFLHASRFALLNTALKNNIPAHLNPVWFLACTLFVGIPGLGIGTSLWLAIYKITALELFNDNGQFIFWILSISWFTALLIISSAIILSIKKHTNIDTIPIENKESKYSMLRAFFFVALLTCLIPIALLFGSNKGL